MFHGSKKKKAKVELQSTVIMVLHELFEGKLLNRRILALSRMLYLIMSVHLLAEFASTLVLNSVRVAYSVELAPVLGLYKDNFGGRLFIAKVSQSIDRHRCSLLGPRGLPVTDLRYALLGLEVRRVEDD